MAGLETFFKRRQRCVWLVTAVLLLSPSVYFVMFITFSDDSQPAGGHYQPQETTKERFLATVTEEFPLLRNSEEASSELGQTRVAILVLDDEQGNMDSFYRTALSYLQYDEEVKVTYFLFFRNLHRYLKQQLLTKDPINNRELDVVHLLTYIREDEFNPCRAYMENAAFHGYFNDLKFDYTVSFDPRMFMSKPIGLIDELLSGDLVAAIHPTFQDFSDKSLFPYDRRPDSCAYVPYGREADFYYAADFISGRPGAVDAFCRAVSTCHYSTVNLNDIKFHQNVNHYFANNPPKRALPRDYIQVSSISEIRSEPAIILRDKVAQKRPPMLNNDEVFDGVFFVEREKRVQSLVATLQQYYLKQAATTFTSPQRFKYIGYHCASSEAQCGGFSAVRGASSLLYFAVATERVFHLEWLDPADASHYFAVNENIYNVSSSLYENKRLAASVNSLTVSPSRADAGRNWSVPFSEMRSYDSLLIGTNRTHSLMKLIFAKRSFYPSLHRGIPDMPEYKGNVDYPVYISAGIRLIFGSLIAKAEKLLHETILGIAKTEKTWDKAAKIGIQIRTCKDCPVPRVKWHQLVCFAEKVGNAIRLQLGQVPRFVFVTVDIADPTEWTAEIRKLLGDELQDGDYRVIVFDTSSIISSSTSNEEQDVNWRKMAVPFINWYLLTRMDWLVISRSNFGETASMFSLKPTERYDHSIFDNSSCRFSWYNQDLTQSETF